MAILNPNALLPDSANFIKNTFALSVGVDFESYREIVIYGTNNNDYDSTVGNVYDPAIAEMLNDIGDDGNAIPVYYTKRKCRTAFLGGNDVVNPLPGYCRNDDIQHPFTTIKGTNMGMGEVYSKEIDDKQQILYLSFGIPEYNNLGSFYKDAFNATLGRIMNSGPGSGGTTFADIGELVGSTAVTFMILPVMPIVMIMRILQGIDKVKITKYFDFKSQMPVYYRMVNSILMHLAVNMGLANDGSVIEQQGDVDQRTGSTTQPLITRDELYRQSAGVDTNKALPDVFGTMGFDIYRIMLYKYILEENASISDLDSTDQALEEMFGKKSPIESVINEAGKSYADDFITAFKNTLYDASLFVGFRCTVSTGSSESIQNSFGTSELANTLNAKLASARSVNFATGDGSSSVYDSVMSALSGFWKGATDTIKLDGIGTAIVGAGIIDIPDVWQGSSFAKSYDFNFEFNALYGDTISIMTQEYVPLALLLAGACPRAVGASSFTSPLLVRAYCKGMFAVPLGAFDSMTITRGGDNHGWNINRLPLQIKVSATIKDLSPAMYPAIASQGLGDAIDNINPINLLFGQNSSFQEYLLTLSGMGLYERISWYQSIKRRLAYALRIGWVNRLSGPAMGMTIGRLTPARILSQFTPTTRIPLN